MSDLRKRPNPENIKRIEQYIEKLRFEIDETRDLAKLKDSEDWHKILLILERKMAAVDFDLDQYEVLEDKIIYGCLQMRKDLKYFISLIDGGEMALDDLNLKLENAKDQLIEYKKRIG